jgi:hypothetical protein
MNAADFLGERFLKIDVAYETFEEIELRCRSCVRHLQNSGEYRVLRASVPELRALSARLVYWGHPKGWDLFIPLSAISLERFGGHLFHEFEVIWDHRFIGLEPVWVQKMLPSLKTLPMPARHGRLPRG